MSANTEPGIVILGGGQAAASCALRLRQKGYEGGVTILCGEPTAPYQRPPLSKAYLMGKAEAERLLIRPEAVYAQMRIDLRIGLRAEAIDPASRTVATGDGTTLPYGQLVLATGARPNRLPDAMGGDLVGVHTLRTLSDIDAIRPDLLPGRRLVVVGGGYVGLEVAAVAIQSGLEVAVLEAAPRVLARVASDQTSGLITALHRAKGCRILTGVQLRCLEGVDGRVSTARLADGTALACDLVVTGIGVRPETELAAAAGIAAEDGFLVDELGQTSVPGIWAIGDCANFPWRQGRLRLESVGHAVAQGEAVADNLLGAATPYRAEPWFWSDQYETKLQIAGLHEPGDHAVLRRTSETVASVWYFRAGRLVAVDAFNDSRAHMVARRILTSDARISTEQAADLDFDLRSVLSATTKPERSRQS